MSRPLEIALCTYSATGNTQALSLAAGRRFEAAGHKVESIDMLVSLRGHPPNLERFDLVGIATPVMMFRPPWVTRRFVEGLSANTGTPAFLLITSSALPANTAGILSILLAEKGLDVRWCWEATCEDSYIPLRRWLGTWWGKGKPDAHTRERAAEFATRVLGDLGDGRRGRVRARPHSPWHLLCHNAPENGAKALLGPRHLEESLCTGCGLCAELCPSGALEMEGDLPRCNAEACLGCCACFNRCPAHAWRLRRFASRYFYAGPGN